MTPPPLPASKVLITGGAGFIGSHLVDALLKLDCEVTVVDNFFLGSDENLGEARSIGRHQLHVYREDAADQTAMTAICEQHPPQVVFNLATKALRYSFLNPPGAFRVNTDIALVLAELQRNGVFERLIHLSSSEVYGTARTKIMSEDHPRLAETTYAAGKAAADLALAAYVRTYRSDIITIRPFNNYGPRQNDQSFAAIIPLTIRRILGGEAPIIEGDGQQTRDFIFVNDTIDAILRLAQHDDASGQEFNLGSGVETSISSLVHAISEVMGYTGEIIHQPARPADVRRHRADVDRAEKIIGPIATTPLYQALEQTVAWYRERERG